MNKVSSSHMYNIFKTQLRLTDRSLTAVISIKQIKTIQWQINREKQNGTQIPSVLFLVQLFHNSVLRDETVIADSSLSAPIAV